ncbi:hypothetical protein [Segetibacter koreensis]|uniref:hypothetical protein n=1 Tax=Segetibacter koreensis TaxID=398037 RepID=UPI00036C10E4|nr:hypothetical protein [Segetibacter koreensis]
MFVYRTARRSNVFYKETPLVHYSEQNGLRSEENKRLTFHWEKLRPDVAKDIQTAKNATVDVNQ